MGEGGGAGGGGGDKGGGAGGGGGEGPSGDMGGGLWHGSRGVAAPAKRKLRPSPRQHCTEYVTFIVGVSRNSKMTAVFRTSSRRSTSPGSAGLSNLFPYMVAQYFGALSDVVL